MLTNKKTKRKPTGAAAKGAGPGRPLGSKNKMPKQLKEMILGALDQAGGEDYLKAQAEANPGAFMTLIGKVLPTTIQGGEGDKGGDVTLIIHTGPRRDEK